MHNLIIYFSKMIFTPRLATRAMLAERQKVGLGLAYIVGFSFLYSLTSLFLYWEGHLPLGPALPIPLERWYLYQAFYTIPVGLASVITLTAVAHGLARALRGKASWQESFMLLSLCAILPWFFFTWIPETLYALLGKDFPWGQTAELFRQVIPAIWQVVLCTLTFAIAQHFSTWKSLLCIVLGTIPFGLFFALFIR